MRQSEKLKLWLPEGSDPLEVSKLSENFEKLDPLGGGLETLKEGTGPGSLFMVSKYYKDPIQNAVLCNGGTVDVGEYPELADVIGMAYGGSITSESENSQYGITSSAGYPIAYNADHDTYIAVSSTSLILYQKGAAPKYTPSVTTINPSATGFKWIFSFGNFIHARITYGTGSEMQILYDISSSKWINTNNGNYDIFHNDSSAPRMQDVGDSVLVTAYAGLYLCGKFDYTDTKKISTINFDDGTTQSPTAANTSVNIRNLYYDKPCILAGNGAVRKLCQIDLDGLTAGSNITVPAHVIKEINFEYSGSTVQTYCDCAIIGGVLYITNGSSNSYILKNDLRTSGQSLSLALSSTQSGVQKNITAAFQITQRYFALCFSGTNTKLYVVDTSSGTISPISFYQTLFDDGVAAGGKVLTKTGPRANFALSQIKLPTITLSESLVYMRTGDGAAE